MNRTILFLSCAAACLLAESATAAGDLQAMISKGGEWEMTVNNGITPTMVQRACNRGDKTVADLTTHNLKNCSNKTIRIAGDVATVDAVCSLNNMQVTVHGVVRPTGEESFHGDSRVHIDGMPAIPGLPSDINMSVDARRIGPCQPGEKGL